MSSQRVRDVIEEMEMDMLRAANEQLQADRLRLIQKNNHLNTVVTLIQDTMNNHSKRTAKEQLVRIQELINTLQSD